MRRSNKNIVIICIIALIAVAIVIVLKLISMDFVNMYSIYFDSVGELKTNLGNEIELPENTDIYMFDIPQEQMLSCKAFVKKSGGGFYKKHIRLNSYSIYYNLHNKTLSIETNVTEFGSAYEYLPGFEFLEDREIDGLQCHLYLHNYEDTIENKTKYSFFVAFNIDNVIYLLNYIFEIERREEAIMEIENTISVLEPIIMSRYKLF